MYVADPCGNDVAIYKDADYIWTYAGHVSGTFHAPLFLTINGRYLAVPNATGISHGAGLVSVVDLTGHSSTTTIANGLTYPVGAAVTAGP
jgi:hypothetical protein